MLTVNLLLYLFHHCNIVMIYCNSHILYQNVFSVVSHTVNIILSIIFKAIVIKNMFTLYLNKYTE